MFDGFMKSKFYTKCKTALKMTKNRVEAIKRKRSSMEKYLRNDIADLLKNEYFLNAYSRVEGLLIEMNKSVWYEYVELYCIVISEHLSVMNKQKECSEECKEAVPSLMFAAARIADLPELRELRTMLADKYGNSLDAHINQEFVEKLEAGPPTKDRKEQLLQEIAAEYGVEWDAKIMEKQLNKRPIAEQAREIKQSKNKPDKPAREVNKQNRERNDTPMVNEKDEVSSRERKEAGNDNTNTLPAREIEIHIDGMDESIAKEKSENKKPMSYRNIPPPYFKPKTADSISISKVSPEDLENHSQDESVNEHKQKPKSVRMTQLKPPPGRVSNNNGGNGKENYVGLGTRNKDPGLKVVLEDASKGGKGNKTTLHSRAASLPPEEISPVETKRGHTRRHLLQPETGNVQPKLLDYDDFLARMAAVKNN